MVNLICNGIGVAMGVAVVALNTLEQVEVKDSLSMLGIGLFCISLSILAKTNENDSVKKLTKSK